MKKGSIVRLKSGAPFNLTDFMTRKVVSYDTAEVVNVTGKMATLKSDGRIIGWADKNILEVIIK